jgi:hypothetical protein
MTRVALALVLVVGSTLFPADSHGHVTMQWGWATELVSRYDSPSCLSSGGVWHQELGSSGITRLRANFERRGANDPGIPGLAYGSTGWMYTTPFPDDYRNFYATWFPKFRYPPGGVYHVRMILIGERPSFWQPDRKITTSLGEIACIVEVEAFS